MKTLIIVESPTKAKTLSKFLGRDYTITASMGHIRDLPRSKIGVDTEHGFAPQYIVSRDKKATVKDLQAKAEKADLIILATDPDREGEAIAWHLAFLLDQDEVKGKRAKIKVDKKKEAHGKKIVRITFHEITEKAIKEALSHPGEIDMKLVNAQQARRILDRLVGYKLSPLLWKKIKKGLSAGRVQSVAVRLIVEREREIEKFKIEEFWTISSKFQVQSSKQENKTDSFLTELAKIEGKKPEIKTKDEAEKLKQILLEQKDYSVSKFEEKEVRRSPYPPFTTSLLQQAASNLFGWGAKRTMMVAQKLYEQGLITYMRTDSFNLNADAVSAARELIAKKYGKEFIPDAPKFYKTKSKGAQEAHEAIRPTDVMANVEIQGDEKKLYQLIYNRTLACQMTDAVYSQRSVEIENCIDSGLRRNDKEAGYLFRGTSSVLKFAGWKKVYDFDVETQHAASNVKNENIIPQLKIGNKTDLSEIIPTQHFTQPPPRFTEASLIKALEELGIGRPSTYAPTISTIQDRYYVEKEERKLKPTTLGMTVNDFLMKYFADILDYQFTAGVENSLDEVAEGNLDWVKVLERFYFPFEKHLNEIQDTAEKVHVEMETTDEICDKCGKPMVVRIGRFGKFIACSGFPECKNTKPIKQKINLSCPKCGADVIAKKTKKGRIFYSCSAWPKCDFAAWKKEEVLRSQMNKVMGGSAVPLTS